MPEPVKPPKRAYNSPRRQQQADATRREILEAARRLFEQQGYAATTMGAIASEAGVALKTVYVAFETKSGVLRALWHVVLRGNDGDVPVADLPWYRETLASPDPVEQLRLNARNSRAVKLRVGAVGEVIRTAAPGDAEIAELWRRIQSDYHGNQRSVVESLHAKEALDRALDVDRATDILWTINHPDVWHLLVFQRGWTPEAYEQWCFEAACSQLLR